ncbi:hypothetical protein KEM60_00457 [Austwickia sp. TVS 96-490-7B]|nr:hypothetical protein [Austwickia sp. TVS 96-490-7B]
MNTRVRCTPSELIVEPVGLDKMWSVTRRLTIPWSHGHP